MIMTMKATLLINPPRITLIVLMMLFGGGGTLAATLHDEVGKHLPLSVVGITPGQTARINVTNSPDPGNTNPPGPITVELCFHDSNGNLIVDLSGRVAQRTVTIDPHNFESLELNANNLVVSGGSRVTIIPCLKILSIREGSLAIPTFEIYNNFLRTTIVLSEGTLRGFDPQPDPPVAPEVSFGSVGLTLGVTARLHVLNDPPDTTRATSAAEPITVEITFHDTRGNTFVDRQGREARKIVTLDPGSTNFLELNGSDIASAGGRVGIIPCIKVLRGSPGFRIAMTMETFINLTGQTLVLANWQDRAER